MRLRSWAPSLTLLWGAYRLRGAYVYGKEGNYRERKGRVGLERRKERKIGNERQRNYKYPFLRASAMLKHVIDIGWTSVCLSVRPSVTRWHCIKTAERIVMIFSPHDSLFILVLCVPRSSRNSDGVTPCGGAKYRWGIKISRFPTNKSLYLANDTRYRQGCYGRRIGTLTRSIKMVPFPMILNEP